MRRRSHPPGKQAQRCCERIRTTQRTYTAIEDTLQGRACRRSRCRLEPRILPTLEHDWQRRRPQGFITCVHHLNLTGPDRRAALPICM